MTERADNVAAERSLLARAAGPLAVALVTVALIAWTWLYCPDPVIDFSREIYIPWLITQHGQVLYGDINYFDGPLGVYVLSAVFAVFGASLTVLKLANAVVTVALSLLIYRLALRLGGAWAAVAAGVTFAVVFATAQLHVDPCFNFLTPYSHNLAYGVGLSLAMVACIGRAARTGNARWVAAAGALLGLVMLTKAEVMLAAGAAGVVGMLAVAVASGSRGRAARLAALFVACALAPVAIATALLTLFMPVDTALRGIAGAWKFIGNRPLMGMTYFRWITGWDYPGANLKLMLVWAGRYVLLIAAAVAVALVARRWRSNAARVFIFACAVAAGLASLLAPLATAARPLPILLALVIAWFGWLLLVRPRQAARVALPLTLAVLALGMLSKSMLRVTLHHYGFALTLPGAVLLVVAMIGWLPRALGGAGAWAARTVMLTAWAVAIGVTLYATDGWMRQRIHAFGEGPDRFYADQRGFVMDEARRYLASRAAPGATMVAIPDASILNYLVRMPSSVRYHNFLPPEIVMFGEGAMLDALRASPPTWVVLVHADTTTYDARFFGRDYAFDIARWVQDNYEPVRVIGAPPYTSEKFGVMILKRREAPAP